MNLWGHALLQQWNTQINIPAVLRSYVSEENIQRYFRQQIPVVRALQEHKAIDGTSEVPTALPLKWLTDKPIWTRQWPLAEEKL